MKIAALRARNYEMSVVRHLTRDWRFCLLLAYAFVLAGLAGARMGGHHASDDHALATLQVICSAQGVTIPSDPEGEHGKGHPGAPCGPCCPFETFGAFAPEAVGLTWSGRTADMPARAALHALPSPACVPPGLSARGPPILI